MIAGFVRYGRASRRRLVALAEFASFIALALVAPLTLVPVAPLAAQAASESPSGAIGAEESAAAPTTSRAQRGGLEAWGGLANRSPQWGILGETPGMNFGVIALRYSQAFGAAPVAGQLPAWEWTFDVIPLALMSPPLISLRGTGVPCESAVLCVEVPSIASTERFPPGSAFGFGVAPLGVVRRFARDRRASPFVAVNGGALVFDRRVPTTKASRFNFTASAELGLRIGPPDESALTVSYRFHHISNAGTAGENPGLASHLITLGLHRPLRSN